MAVKLPSLHRRLHQTMHDSSVTGSARLPYYNFEGIITGLVSNSVCHATAWRGGAGGSTRHNPNDTANNPYMYALKEVDDRSRHVHIHGGPIPPGRYRIHAPGPNK